MRPDLASEALRLGRVLAELVPDEPEVHGLVALMEIQASRLPARIGPDGAAGAAARPGPAALGPAADPPRAGSRWAGPSRCRAPIGPYTLQAAIAACHARAGHGAGHRLGAGSPRCTRCSASCGRHRWSSSIGLSRLACRPAPRTGWPWSTRWPAAGELAGYPQLPAVRGDLLARLGRVDEARTEFERAAELTRNARERALFLARAAPV